MEETGAIAPTPRPEASAEPGRRPPTTLEISGVAKAFGSVIALEDVSLDVRTGELLTLLGPSGSGKTTLLNVLAGFERADRGAVLLDGRDIGGTPAHRRGFGMVFQSYALLPHFTVAENVAYPLRMRHLPRSERAALVRQYLQIVELEQLADRLPHELSGGQQQRVALARALVFRPTVLLMDEPLGALDRRLRQSLQFEIKRLHAELGTTIVTVTHDQEEALSMSDRIAVMSHGRVEQVDVPRAVYERPATEFVAAFLGETNFFDVEITPGPAGMEIRHVATGQLVERNVALVAGHARMSIRPEHFRVTPATDAGDALVGRAMRRTFMGDEWRCECHVEKEKIVVHVPIREPYVPEPGELVRLEPIPGLGVIFTEGRPQGEPSRAKEGSKGEHTPDGNHKRSKG